MPSVGNVHAFATITAAFSEKSTLEYNENLYCGMKKPIFWRWQEVEHTKYDWGRKSSKIKQQSHHIW